MSEDEDAVPQAVPLSEDAHGNEVSHPSNESGSDRGGAVLASSRPPVPVTLITGCLGAGKSTLINRILTTQHGLRCAVVMNEYGESADMEKALIKEPEDTSASPLKNWVQLENGCICCTVKSGMVRALEELLQQRDGFDVILIETTGLANPGPVASSLWTDAELEAGVCLDAVITVVDARHIRRQLGDPEACEPVPAALQQIAFADIILLNKIDLVPVDVVRELVADLERVNAAARIIPCIRCDVDLKSMLRTGIYGETGRQQQDDVPSGETSISDHHLASHNSADHHHQHSLATADVSAVTLRATEPLDLRLVEAWMDRLLWGQGEAEVYRVKAVLDVLASTCRHVLQAVYDLYEVRPATPWGEKEARTSKVVVIGRRLVREDLQADLDACAASGK